MRIVFVQPPSIDGTMHQRHQPLGLGYLAAVLEQAGHTVSIIESDLEHLSCQQAAHWALNSKPNLVGMTCFTPTFPQALIVAQVIKNQSRIPIIMGGPHATADPQGTLETGVFDIVIIGEGERTIVELVHYLEKGQDLAQVKGIAYQDSQGKYRQTLPRPYIQDLDSLPLSARHLLHPLTDYRPTPASYRRWPVGDIITSRGCPFKCIFCDRGIFGNQHRFRSPTNVVNEIEILVKKYGAQEIRFWDDTFNNDPKRVLEICQLIGQRRLDITWTCLGRVNYADRQVLKAMAQAGCWKISYGIESGNQAMLQRMKKGITLDMARTAVKRTKEAGIQVKGFFILGLPGETLTSAQQTIDFAQELNLDVATFSLATPYPGTEFYQQVSSTLPHQRYDQFLQFKTQEPVYSPADLTPRQLQHLQKQAYRRFYFRPSYILNQMKNKHFWPAAFDRLKAVLALGV